MTTTLVLTEALEATFRALTRLKVESGGVLLARMVCSPNGDQRLLGREFIPIPEASYARRLPDELLITSDGFVPALGKAETTRTVPIWLHTHPGDGASPRPSSKDRVVDDQLTDVFRLRSGSDVYGSVIVSSSAAVLRFTGFLDQGGERVDINRLIAVGSRISLAWHDHIPGSSTSPQFERNILALGDNVQRVLQDLQIAIVGCGGTGSSVAEQLVRLGVRKLLLIDPDNLTHSNITRTYGSRATDVGRAKVQVLADSLLRIAPDARPATVISSITVEATARQLCSADVVFGCTDDNAGRLVLSRLATYMVIPVFDLGVLLSGGEDQMVEGIHGRITMLYPGVACLVCRGRIDLGRARSEMLSIEEQGRRLAEGYAPALPGAEPAVVAFTTLVAATAISELLEHLIGYGPEPVPSEVVLRIHDREMSVNHQLPQPRHYCDPAAGKIGLGDTEPFLEQVWSV